MFEDLFAKSKAEKDKLRAEYPELAETFNSIEKAVDEAAVKIGNKVKINPMSAELVKLHSELETLAAGRTEDNIPLTERAYWDKRNEILIFRA